MLLFGIAGLVIGGCVYYVMRSDIQNMPMLTKRKRWVHDLFYGYFSIVGFIAIISMMMAAVWHWESSMLNVVASLFGGGLLGGMLALGARLHRRRRKRKKAAYIQHKKAA